MTTLFFLIAMLFSSLFAVMQVMRDENISALRSWKTIAKVLGWVVVSYGIAMVATSLSFSLR